MKNYFYLLLSAVFVFSACSDKENNLDGNDNIARCLMSKDFKYEELLTKEDIVKHINIDEGSYKREISTYRSYYGSSKYTWDSDRPGIPMEILGQVFSAPDDNMVEVKHLDFYTDSQLKLYQQADAIALFEQSYKRLSQQEYQELLANLEKAYADDPAGFEQAKGFLDARMNFTFEPIENLGDRSYWKWHDQYGIELVVLAGAAHFTIATKLSANAEPSLELAIAFAREVLAKCGG